MGNYLETLNYSSLNEDSRSEMRSLDISGDDKVLCITGSGSRTLDLLTTHPDLIVSIDMNHCQNFLLELQMAAIKLLEYQEMLGFIGITEMKDRVGEYRKLRGTLSPAARSYWDANTGAIGEGVFYSGRWERYFGMLATMVERFRPEKRQDLFACPDRESQKSFWEAEWEGPAWKVFLRIVSLRFCNQFLLKDPGFYLHVSSDFQVYRYLTHRFRVAATNVLFRESPFAELLFYGRLSQALPEYLRPENYSHLRESLSAVRMVTGSLSEYIASVNGERFDAFSLSDISSYTEASGYGEIWNGITRISRHNSRICERQFLVKRDLPPVVKHHFIQDTALQDELNRSDGSIFYTLNIYRTV